MAQIELKEYQKKALSQLLDFLNRTRIVGVETTWCEAMAKQGRSGTIYNAQAFGEVPCVCLRIPTGGGKTLLAAHAIAQAGKALRSGMFTLSTKH